MKNDKPKENFNDKLENLLKTDSRFVDEEGNLIKSEVVDKAWKFDKDLINILFFAKNKEIKDKFFKQIKESWVFNVVLFVDFVKDKNFLVDSYTKFGTKIGLTLSGKHLKQRGDVTLVWPFKDCVLEGGMSNEEDKCKETFFNEILAQDEIDRLLHPKVLTNGKQFSDGNERSGNKLELTRDKSELIRDNLIIKGNNLLAMHSIKEEFSGKIKLIYIDPPYNTGKDGFKYNDNFSHSTWLTFMKNRLEVARELLRNDGVIFVQCDDNEQAYLKVLMDDVFGRNNFVNTIVWLNKEGGGKSDSEFFIKKEEYSHCFAKKIDLLNINKIVSEEDDSYNRSDEYQKERGKYKLIKLNSFSIQYSESLNYEIELPNGEKISPTENGKKGCWRWGKNQFEWGLENGYIEFKNNAHGKLWVYTKQYFKVDIKGNPIKRSLPYTTRIDEFSSTTATKEQEKLFGKKLFKYPKPEGYIGKIIEISTNEKDIVLDYHLGSGTTCAVAHKMGRQYIGIEQMDYVESIAVERLKKVIDGEQGGISEAVNWKKGGGFVYLELKRYNQEFIVRILAAKTPAALEGIWEEMKDKSFLNWEVDLKKEVSAFKEWAKMSIEGKQEALISLLDKNQLYVNLSDIEDKGFCCTKDEKELSNQFYKKLKQ